MHLQVQDKQPQTCKFYLVGSFVWGSIADIKGRIPVLVLCQIINTLFTVGASTSQSLWFLTVMRFFWGFG